MSTSSCEHRRDPTPSPSPLIRLNTPGGNPASWTISAKSSDERGAISDGLSTHVHPTRRAGIALRVTWLIGQFQGVISATTPMGSYRMMVSDDRSSLPGTRRSCSKCSSAFKKFRMLYIPDPACTPRAASMGEPISALMRRAISSRRRRYIRNSRST